MPLLALFTGARLEELCQLAVEDIKQVDGIWCMDINENRKNTSLKSKAAKRMIPIHPFLLNELNLVTEYIAKLKTTKGEGGITLQLFPNLHYDQQKQNWSAPLSQWFTRYRRLCEVGNSAGNASAATFHSFRHTLSTELIAKKLVNERMVQKVPGHESGSGNLGITENYTGDYPVKILLDGVIMKIDFQDRIAGLQSLTFQL